MLAGESRMQGHKIGLAIWTPFDKAPRDGTRITVRRRSGAEERAAFRAGRWWMVAFVIPLMEGGVDPVTHFHV